MPAGPQLGVDDMILSDQSTAAITRTALAELAAVANAAHAAGEAATRKGLEQFRAAGEALLKAKEQCGHGGWLSWVKENLAFSDRTARDYMRLARHWGELAAAANLRDALRLLTGDDPEPSDARTRNSCTPTAADWQAYTDELGEALATLDDFEKSATALWSSRYRHRLDRLLAEEGFDPGGDWRPAADLSGRIECPATREARVALAALRHHALGRAAGKGGDE